MSLSSTTTLHMTGFASLLIGGKEVTQRKQCRVEVKEGVAKLASMMIFYNVQGEGSGKCRVYRNLSSDDWLLEFVVNDITPGEDVVITRLPETAITTGKV